MRTTMQGMLVIETLESKYTQLKKNTGKPTCDFEINLF